MAPTTRAPGGETTNCRHSLVAHALLPPCARGRPWPWCVAGGATPESPGPPEPGCSSYQVEEGGGRIPARAPHPHDRTPRRSPSGLCTSSCTRRWRRTAWGPRNDRVPLTHSLTPPPTEGRGRHPHPPTARRFPGRLQASTLHLATPQHPGLISDHQVSPLHPPRRRPGAATALPDSDRWTRWASPLPPPLPPPGSPGHAPQLAPGHRGVPGGVQSVPRAQGGAPGRRRPRWQGGREGDARPPRQTIRSHPRVLFRAFTARAPAHPPHPTAQHTPPSTMNDAGSPNDSDSGAFEVRLEQWWWHDVVGWWHCLAPRPDTHLPNTPTHPTHTGGSARELRRPAVGHLHGRRGGGRPRAPGDRSRVLAFQLVRPQVQPPGAPRPAPAPGERERPGPKGTFGCLGYWWFCCSMNSDPN